MIRHVAVPVGAAFLALSAMALAAGRYPVPRPMGVRTIRSRRDLVSFLRSAVVTAVGGYIVFLAMIAVFSVGIVGDVGALVSAAWSGAFLAGGSMVLFLGVMAARSRRAGGG